MDEYYLTFRVEKLKSRCPVKRKLKLNSMHSKILKKRLGIDGNRCLW